MPREKPNWGPAIVDGNIRYTSVSAIQTYDPLTYGGCPRRYFFKYVQKRDEPTTKAQAAGVEGHEQIEHWLLTEEDVLGPVVRAGQHLIPRPGKDLIVEKGFGNATKAIALRDARLKASPTASWDALLDEDVGRIAGLSVAGIPLVGFIDIRHSRGEYVDSDGALKKERSEHGRVVELIDHKFISNLSYAKTPAELVESVQMLGYDNVREVVENADYVRNSHISYQTRGAKAAKKVTAIMSVEQARKGWERVHVLGREMIDVARAARPEEVGTQLASCGAFHVGCPHSSYCSRPHATVHDLFQISKGASMGTLFDDVSKPGANGASATAPAGLFAPAASSAPAVPALPVSEAERQAVVDAEKARLLASGYGTCAACNVALDASNASRLPDGTVKHIGCLSSFLTAPIPAIPSIGAVNPPDAPPFDPLTAAEPLSEEAIAAITDPELKARAIAHAAAVKAAAPPPLPGKEKTSGRCVGGGQRFVLTTDEVATKKKACPVCGKEIKLKIAKEADGYAATLGGHLMPKEAPAVPTAPAASSQSDLAGVPPPLPVVPLPSSLSEYAAPGALPGQTAMPVIVPPLPAIPPLPVFEIASDFSHFDEAKRILARIQSDGEVAASSQNALVAIAHALIAIAEQ